MEVCKKSKRLSDTTQIKTTDRHTSLNSLLCSGHRVLFAREKKYERGRSSGCGSRREYRQTIFYSSRAALPSPFGRVRTVSPCGTQIAQLYSVPELSGLQDEFGSGCFRDIYARDLFVAVPMISTGEKILRK
jgi:hypothetical protein